MCVFRTSRFYLSLLAHLDHMHRSRIVLLSLVFSATVKAAIASTTESCSCGYYDATTGATWTESIIIYFNETNGSAIPSFIQESYVHKYEKGWDTQFRTGADVSNIELPNFTSAPSSLNSLAMKVSPYNADHIVVGSSLRTSRQDIQYGSFTSLLRSPGKFAGGGGSVLSFALNYNSTQTISINLQNTDKPSTASISTLADEESPDFSLINYDNVTNGSFGEGTLSPWDYTEYQMEWTKDQVRFLIGQNLVRSISRSEEEGLLSVPSRLYLRHWSNGLATGSQGPPNQPTVAYVGWTRLFFNSSLMTDSDHASFDGRCQKAVACLVGDMTLRGSSVYSEMSIKEWKQPHRMRPKSKVAIWLAVSCICTTALLLLNPMWKRIHERLAPVKEVEMMPQTRRKSSLLDHERSESTGLGIESTPYGQKLRSSIDSRTLMGTNRSSPTAASFNSSQSSPISPRSNGDCTFRRRSACPSDQPSGESKSHDAAHRDCFESSKPSRPDVHSPAEAISRVATLERTPCASSVTEEHVEREARSDSASDAKTVKDRRISWNMVGWGKSKSSAPLTITTASGASLGKVDFKSPKALSSISPKTPKVFPNFPENQGRSDKFAGLIVVACLLVTAINFNLTFLYGDMVSDRFIQRHGEVTTRKTIASFLLNPIWIGPFLLTSARFLTTDYLCIGDLLTVAEKTVKRSFRLMLPVIAMVMLEYFFIDCSATKWLEYLPSITWSTWPFIKGYSNFGNFLNEILELLYLIPNAAPIVTFNYCGNVLWTIPVQLQGSWTTLLAVIIIREIKTPWKRFGFYGFCIFSHWYALSWGSYFYFGILLTDLDITYKWQTYLHARLLYYYPLLFLCIILTFAGPSLDLLTQRQEIDYAAYEYGIHPNPPSGLPISQDSRSESLKYFLPRLNGLIFAVGLQAVVELSPYVQKILSNKLFMLISPHVFTIYLIHGFIFWTFGPWLCIFLAVCGLSYWSNILLVTLCSYTILALSVPLLTPVLDCLGKTITADIWRQAREEPAPRRPTLYPFPRDLFLNRYEVSWEGKPSEHTGVEDQQARKISRVRKPSKDLETSWYGAEPSPGPGTSAGESGPPADRRVSWHERTPSHELRASWNERKVSRAGRLERVEDAEEGADV